MLEVKKINKKYKNKIILRDVSFKIEKGEVISIIGKSGEGKSTLIKCLNGLELIDNGEIILDNVDISKMKKSILRQRIGIVFQDYNLFDNLNIIDNLTIGLIKIKKFNTKVAIDKAREMLKELELSSYEKFFPEQLSGGQRQRIAIGRALLMKPEILLLDEPTSALDEELKKSVIDLIFKIAKEDMTLIIVSHEINMVKKISDKIYKLENGILKKVDKLEGEENELKH